MGEGAANFDTHSTRHAYGEGQVEAETAYADLFRRCGFVLLTRVPDDSEEIAELMAATSVFTNKPLKLANVTELRPNPPLA